MAERQISFNDGAAYERMMGVWSRSVGEIFLDWLAPAPGLRWVDVGCGNGAFTALLCQCCAPTKVDGIDPSDAQLAFARTRPDASRAQFHKGDAMALPFPDNSFDAATMALVMFFVPEPVRGLAEMMRVTAPGGLVAAYVWDILGGGFPAHPVQTELQVFGHAPLHPPSVGISRMEPLRALWADAGLDAVETREITVSRTFADFDEFWSITAMAPSVTPVLAGMTPADVATLRQRVSARLPAAADGSVTFESRANAVKGRVPG